MGVIDPGDPETPEGQFGRLPDGSADLRVRTARGSIINGGFVVGTSALSVLQTVIVARLLPTSVFGRWGLLMAAFMTILMLTSVGVDDKYIQQDAPDQEHAFRVAFTLQVLLGGVLAVLLLVGIPLFALLYGRTDIIAPGLVLVVALPAMVLEMPLWVHYRRMDYARQRQLQLIDPAVTFVATVGLAIAGLGIWALAIGAVTGTWAAAAVIARTSPYRLGWAFDRAALAEYRRFSMPLFFAAISTVVLVQAPVSVGSRVLGVTAVAGIALANNISQFTTQVDGIVSQTLYPVICAVKDRQDLLVESFWKSNRLALLWATPVGLAAPLFAGDFVHFVIGEKWRFAVPLIAIVAVNAVVNQIAFNGTAFFRAVGDTRPVAICSAVGLVAMVAIAVPLLAALGLTAFGIGLSAVTVLSMLTRVWFLRRLFPGFGFVRHVARGIGPTLPAVACVLVVRHWEQGSRTLAIVVIEAVIYAVVAAVATYASDGRLLRESVGYLRRRQLSPVPS